MLFVLDMLGVVAFSASGALAAVRARLDVFGVVILGMITALGGGVILGVLLDVTPPTSLREWPYLLGAAATSIVVFAFHRRLAKLRPAMLIADAMGLALFTVAGTATALAHDVPAYSACLIGMAPGIGGGALRDVLLRQIPLVFHREIYGLAALAGAVVVAVGDTAGLSTGPVAVVGAVLIVSLRLIALWRHWDAPVARDVDDQPAD